MLDHVVPEGPRVGTVIDERFELEAMLGSGGAGVVWRAKDRQSGDRVAIKILHPRFARPGSVARRFEREGRLLEQLVHPGIARPVAIEPDRPEPYLAMELVDGITLKEDLEARAKDQRPLEPSVLGRRLVEICAAVAHAHRQGVLHRDLKPENMMIEREPSGRVKILDFGLGRLLDANPHEATTQGRRLGSLFYMAPEQMRGEGTDPRSDVFALGCLCFELATLRRTWAVDDAGEPISFAQGIGGGPSNAGPAVLARVASGPRPRPGQWRADLPPSFDQVVRQALSADPTLRPADAGALLSLLRSVFEPSLKRRRAPLQLGVIGAALLLVSALIVLVLTPSRSSFAPEPPTTSEGTLAPPQPPLVPVASARPGLVGGSTITGIVSADPAVKGEARRPTPIGGKAKAPRAKEPLRYLALQQSVAGLRKDPGDRARLQGLADDLRAASRSLSNPRDRAEVDRLATAAALVGDVDGLAAALDVLQRSSSEP